jgi:hypothetical protein
MISLQQRRIHSKLGNFPEAVILGEPRAAQGESGPEAAEDARVHQTCRKRAAGEVSYSFVVGEAREQKQEGAHHIGSFPQFPSFAGSLTRGDPASWRGARISRVNLATSIAADNAAVPHKQ